MENPETFTGELYVPLLIQVEVQKSVAMMLLHIRYFACSSPLLQKWLFVPR